MYVYKYKTGKVIGIREQRWQQLSAHKKCYLLLKYNYKSTRIHTHQRQQISHHDEHHLRIDSIVKSI